MICGAGTKNCPHDMSHEIKLISFYAMFRADVRAQHGRLTSRREKVSLKNSIDVI